MRCRCPFCHEPVEIVDGDTWRDMECPCCGSTFRLVDDESTKTYRESPQVLAHFELLARVGSGKFGTVWKARDKELDRIVAIKIPRLGELDAANAEQFFREARAAAQIKHPNIVGVHEVGRDGNRIYIVSDFIDGANLKEHLAVKRFPPKESAEIGISLAEALHAAHDAGVIHRDLKPQNIMVDASGRPYVTDFGLAKRDVGEITVTVDGAILGTPAYMSPEQASGSGHSADRRSDVYSLGVVLFELLTGELPFRGERQMLLLQIQRDEPPRLTKLDRTIDQDLETITLKCLSKNPDHRYASAMELAKDLQRWLNHEPIRARRIRAVGRTIRWAQRRPALAGMIALLALVTMAGMIGTLGSLRLAWINNAALQDATNALQQELVNVQREKNRADENLKALDHVVGDFFIDFGRYLENAPGATHVRASLTRDATDYYTKFIERNANSQLEQQLASAHLALGRILYLAGRIDESAREFEAAKEIYGRIGTRDREDKLGLALIHHHLALTLNESGKTSEAENLYRKGALIFEEYLEQDPLDRQARVGLAQCYGDLGGLLSQTGRFPEANESLKDGMRVWQSLIDSFPDDPDHKDSYGKDLLRLSITVRQQGDVEEGKRLTNECIELYEEIVDKYRRHEYRYDLALCYKAYGQMEQDLEKGDALLNKAVTILRDLIRINPGNLRYPETLAATYTDLSNRHAYARNTSTAAKYLQHATSINRQIFERLSSSTRSDIRALSDLKRVADSIEMRLSKESDSATVYKSLLKQADQLYSVSADPAALLIKCESALRLGTLYQRLSRFAQARQACIEAEEGYLRLLSNDPENTGCLSGLAMAFVNHGIIDRSQNRIEEAREKYGRASELLEKLLQREPGVFDHVEMMAGNQVNIGNTYVDEDELHTAIYWFDRAEKELRRVVGINPSRSRAVRFLKNLLYVRADACGRLAQQATEPADIELWTWQAISDQLETYGPFPDDPHARVRLGGHYVNLANAFCRQGLHERELVAYDRGFELLTGVEGKSRTVQYAVEFRENAVKSMSRCFNNRAWVMATDEVEDRNEAFRAVFLAFEACKVTEFSNHVYLDTLAAAYADLGEFEQAEYWQAEAIKFAPPKSIDALKQTLDLYEHGVPTRQPPERAK